MTAVTQSDVGQLLFRAPHPSRSSETTRLDEIKNLRAEDQSELLVKWRLKLGNAP